MCVKPALCANTYGGYRCVCNGTDVDETQSCILGESTLQLHVLINMICPDQQRGQAVRNTAQVGQSLICTFELLQTESRRMISTWS